MAYTHKNFKTKKALIEAVNSDEKVSIYSPGPFKCNMNGTETIEGPHYPKPHRWYAAVVVKDGVIQSVK